MPTGIATIDIRATRHAVFDLIHDYDVRLDWDPFLREARLLNGASAADAGVISRCAARRTVGGLAMETIYVSFNRPTVAAVRMTRGPFFMRSFAASIRHEQIDDETSRVTYRYNFTMRPRSIAFLAEPVAQWVFHRETRHRLIALKRYLECDRPPQQNTTDSRIEADPSATQGDSCFLALASQPILV